MPWYGERLITDTKCADPTCTHDCQLGCIGTDNPTCARCIYNYRSCISTFEKPGDCDELVKGQEIRGNPNCVPPYHEGVYVKFSTKWDPIHVGTGKCGTGQLGASVGGPLRNPEAFFNPAHIYGNSGFAEPVRIIEILGKGNPTQYYSAVQAHNDCYKDFQNPADKDWPCRGFNYSNPNVDPLLRTKADVTFMSGRLTQISDINQAVEIATWEAPMPTPAQKEELVV